MILSLNHMTIFISSKKSFQLCSMIKHVVGEDEQTKNVALLLPNDASYVTAKWALFILNYIGKYIYNHIQYCYYSKILIVTVVPLLPSHPDELKNYYIKDSKADLIITNEYYANHSKEFLKDKQVKILKCIFICALTNFFLIGDYFG